MKTKLLLLLSISFVFMLSSCSERLTGTWTIENYETKSLAGPGATLQNIGQITFHDDNTGENILNYEVFGSAKNDTVPFVWTKREDYVTIDSKSEEFSKTWIIIKDRMKSQTWKTTAGSGVIQVLELSK